MTLRVRIHTQLTMSPRIIHTPLSGGDRKALAKELTKARAMTRIMADRANEKRAAGEALIREAGIQGTTAACPGPAFAG